MLNMGLGFVFNAQDMASGAIKNLERNFMSLDRKVGLGTQSIQGSFAQLGIGMAVVGAGAVMVGGAFALANAASKFEQGLAAIGSVTKATREEMDALRETAIKAGIETQFSPDEAVEGLMTLATAGQTAEQSTKTLIPVLDLAAGSIGQLGIAGAADAVVGTLNAYSMSADQAASVTDKLLRATQLTNFQARDFEIGLSKAAATGAVFNQSLDDVLIAMGLLRNRNIDASSSATAFREATRRVGAESRATEAIVSAGVDVFDKQSGKMRSIVDIMSEFAVATKDMTEEERNRRVVTGFGARGLLAFSAIMNASFTTMRDGQQVTLRGAEAIEAMRAEMSKAGGTAAGFREQLLDTFEGQKILLQGSMQTLAVIMGEPFTQVFKPIVGVIVTAVNAIIAVFKKMPDGVKKAFAWIVVGTGAIVTMVGALIAGKAAIALAAIALKALGITIGGIVAAIAPAIGWALLLAAVIGGIYVAARDNIGGFGDMLAGAWYKIQLGFDGLIQLFRDGGFSGSVRDELNKADNHGLKGFLVSVFVWVERIRNFFRGIFDGFQDGVKQAEPVIARFGVALGRLGEALGMGVDVDSNAEKWMTWGEIGTTVGNALATVFEIVIEVVTALIDIGTGLVRGFGDISVAGDIVWDALDQLGTQLGTSINYMFGLTGATGQAGDGWVKFGEVISYVIAVAIGIIGVFVSVVSAAFAVVSGAIEIVKSVFSGLADVFAGVVFMIGGLFSGSWTEIWTGMKLVAFGVIDGIIGALIELVGVFAGVADALGSLVGEDFQLQNKLRGFKDYVHNEMSQDMGLQGMTFSGQRTIQTSTPVPGASPYSYAPAAAIASLPSPQTGGASAREIADEVARRQKPAGGGVTHINLQVDGQTLATAVHSSDKDAAGRAFSPVPAY